MKNYFKGRLLALIILLFFAGLAKGQSPTTPVITYTPMTAAGYQFKYLKADSGLNVPNRDTSYGRGTRRGGSFVFDTTNRVFYGWDGIRWNALGNTTSSGIFVDSITVSGNNVCQWVQGVPTCYTISGGGTFTGVDSLTYTGNSLCWWKTGVPTCYAMVPGVDSVTLTGSQLCQWVGGVSTCYTIDGSVLGTGIDSITVVGDQLCQWISGASTCYTINNTSSGIDSITVSDSLLCTWTGGVSSCFDIWHKDTVRVTDDLYVVWDSTGHQVIGRLHDDGRVWGGLVTGGTDCMDIDITPTNYYLGGVNYLSAQTTLTISAADPTLNRYDLIVVDTFGLVTAIPGTAAANPVVPQHNPGSQIPLTSIYVPAGATCLPISKGMIYNENIEYTTGSTGTITVDYDNTANPHALTKAAYVSEYDYGSTLTFTKPSGQDTIRSGAILKFWIYLVKQFTGSLQVQFFLNSTPVSSRQAVSSSDGFLPLDTTQYRNISMVVGNWVQPPTIWNKLVIYPSGQDLSGAGGFYLDEIQVQTGLSPQGKSYVDSVYRIGDSLYYTKSGIQTFISGVSAGGGGGTVTDVTGTSPIIITGTSTVTPNVTIQQATNVTDGYLSFSDWVTFDSAVISITNPSNSLVVFRHANGVLDTLQITPVPIFNAIDSGLVPHSDGTARQVLHGDGVWRDTTAAGAASVDWAVTGNAGTTYSTNYVGTSDSVKLAIKTNNHVAIEIDRNTIPRTYISGVYVGKGTSTVGSNWGNVMVGDSAGLRNTTGTWNTAIGDSAMQLNTTGVANTAIGWNALKSNLTGGDNTAVGSETLLNVTNNHNTGVGYRALRLQSTATNNTAVGSLAMASGVITGGSNTAVGYSVLANVSSGTNNVGMGQGALGALTTGSNNTIIGMSAGAAMGTAGTGSNTGMGWGSLGATTGHSNTAIGFQSGYYNTTGLMNVYLGRLAGSAFANTTNSNKLYINNDTTDVLIAGDMNTNQVQINAAKIPVFTTHAALEVKSTTGAFMPPVMTATQGSAITKSNGMIIYVTDTDATFTAVGFWGVVNTVWTKLHL